MIVDGIIKEVIEVLLERMRELETIKVPPMVHGFTWLRMAGIGERAKHGNPLTEPYGSTRSILGFDDLMFVPAQISKSPVDFTTVNTKTIIGPASSKPMTISTPVMVKRHGLRPFRDEGDKDCGGERVSPCRYSDELGGCGLLP